MPKKSKFVSRISLAAFPVAIVMILLAVEILVRQHILFTSLVSSIFLIYVKPDDPTNDTFTIMVSQIIAAIIGYSSFRILGNSYWATCITVITVTFILILIRKLHPPAIASPFRVRPDVIRPVARPDHITIVDKVHISLEKKLLEH